MIYNEKKNGDWKATRGFAQEVTVFTRQQKLMRGTTPTPMCAVCGLCSFVGRKCAALCRKQLRNQRRNENMERQNRQNRENRQNRYDLKIPEISKEMCCASHHRTRPGFPPVTARFPATQWNRRGCRRHRLGLPTQRCWKPGHLQPKEGKAFLGHGTPWDTMGQ